MGTDLFLALRYISLTLIAVTIFNKVNSNKKNLLSLILEMVPMVIICLRNKSIHHSEWVLCVCRVNRFLSFL